MTFAIGYHQHVLSALYWLKAIVLQPNLPLASTGLLLSCSRAMAGAHMSVRVLPSAVFMPTESPLICYVFVSQALLPDGDSATCSCSMPVHKKRGPRGRQAAMRHWFALTRVAGAAAAADTPPARPAAPDRPPNPVP